MATKIFKSPLLERNKRTALIILNTPISRPPSIWFQSLWKLAVHRICADGGANRLYHATHPSTDYIPDIIRGDLDSLLPHVSEYYQLEHNTSVEKDPCQNSNDLDKALQVCQDYERVIIYGAFGGRFYQEMGCIQALYKWAPTFDHQLFLYNEETCAFLIPANEKCHIELPCYDDTLPKVIGEGPTVGLIPIGCKCDSVVTKGLKWDLDGNMPLEFGQLVSSSNRAMKPTLEITSSHPFIFTAELITAATQSSENETK